MVGHRGLALLALASLCARAGGAPGFKVSEQLLAVHQPGVTFAFLASPDARHLAWVEQAEARQRVMLDGRPVAIYPQVAGLVFSADGEHLAHSARVEQSQNSGIEWTVVLDGREYGRYDAVDPPVLDYDARMLGFTAQERYGPRAAVINGVRQGDRDTAVSGSIVLSRRGRRAAWVERDGSRMRVVVDGDAQAWHDFVNPASLRFSPDGAHLGYTAGHTDPLFVFDDRVVGVAEDKLGPAFDSTGAGVAWAITDGVRWRLYARYPGRLVDRQPDEVPLSLLFSPDGRHLAATMRKPLGTAIVLLDDSVIAEHDAAKGLCFSADGSSLAWLEQVKGGWRVVSGGRTGARYANAWFLTLGPDGRHYACVTSSRRGYNVVLDGEVVGRYDDLVSGFVFPSAGELRFIARRRDRYLLVGAAVPAGPGN